MLPRKKLILLKDEFQRIRKDGKMYDSPSFGLVVSYEAKDGPQAAFVVSKKVDKSSVSRHTIKRKLSDAVSPFLPRVPKNTELTFLAKLLAKNMTVGEIGLEIQSVLKRAKLI